MRIIPVIDVLNGIVVRGIGGRRDEYRPIVSQLTTSVDPVKVAGALIEAFHPRELYLADLDAISGETPAIKTYRAILGLGVRMWIDAGICDGASATRVAESGCDVVAGLETVPGPEVLSEIVTAIGADRAIFSLDLRDGVPLRNWSSDPIRAAVGYGINRVIVLDLACVGGGCGTGTEQHCHQIATTYSHVELFAGGGIGGTADLQRLEACGVKGALVASALHDGRITQSRAISPCVHTNEHQN
jgi:phosphoribosylformimino-5-aminoimidazole carboxamide ribotide isomerase